MGSIGTGEILLVAIVALVVLGPEKLPRAARQAGKAIAELKRLTSDVRNEVDKAMNEADAKDQPTEKPADVVEDEMIRTDVHPGTDGFELIDKRKAERYPQKSDDDDGQNEKRDES